MLSYAPGVEPSPLSIWMEKIPPCLGELSWCHSTDVFTLQKIIRSGEFWATEPCDVFGERISYLSYGRPAYKRVRATSMRVSARAPVVIMMSSDILGSRKRVFPFDTGAFVQGPYGDCYQVEALVSMITDTDALYADDRRLAIELQIDQPIPFAWPQVRALILPRDIKESQYLSTFLDGPGHGVEIRWYDVAPLKLALEYQGLLEHLALELQSDWRLL